MCEKSGKNYNFVGTEKRNVFENRLSAAALKCSTGSNMHGERECHTNDSMEDDFCPRHSEPED